MRIWPIAWIYRNWGDRRPSISSDEYGRHTLALPWPITKRRDDAGFPLCTTLIVALPWFPCDCLRCEHTGTRSTVHEWDGPTLIFCDECGAEL